ncbi:hypothetical protein K3495_g5585 [Podosphaera aphanis]|nr:hypothetical protein K3495_g5585 [Podosphaera aphanis]
MARVLPAPEELVGYNHAVAGHDGILCDADGELFIKPCTDTEVTFYEISRALHPQFVEIIPRFLGVLALEQKTSEEKIEDIGAQLLEKVRSEQPEFKNATSSDAKINVPGKRIQTNQAVVLESASHGLCRPNILDVKLGVRLWADDAPEQKRIRFDKITAESTHKDLGFRIAGMRVWQGPDATGEDIDEEGYRIYDKNYGRIFVNTENVNETFKKFIFNEGAGVDEKLGKFIAQALLAEVDRIQKVLESHENRMFSASLLFVFEGDGTALKTAIERNRVSNELSDEEKDNEPKIYSVKLIDFAHAKWTPGSGPDENTLCGVRSVGNILRNLA